MSTAINQSGEVDNKEVFMARPIKETPAVFGKDAERFEKLISNPLPASEEEKERARKAYEIMKSISNFQWYHNQQGISVMF